MPIQEFLGAGDVNGDGELSHFDIDSISHASRNQRVNSLVDVTSDGSVDADDISFWVDELANTYFGDANLDGEFNSGDFVACFRAVSMKLESKQAGARETGTPTAFSTAAISLQPSKAEDMNKDQELRSVPCLSQPVSLGSSLL
jgi:hypothetical protein